MPITPYKNTSVLVGIGQRYNAIVEANQEVYNATDSLQTMGVIGYALTSLHAGERIPIAMVRRGSLVDTKGQALLFLLAVHGKASCGYERTSTAIPSSGPWQGVPLKCSDETYTDLHPVLPWTVADPINGSNVQKFDLSLHPPENPPFPLAAWELSTTNKGFSPIRVNYSDLTYFHLDNQGPWDPLWRIIPENYTSKD